MPRRSDIGADNLNNNKMEVNLSNLSIGFNSDIKVIRHNEFEITGDISITAVCAYDDTLPKKRQVDRLRVVYNHDGLLEHVYDGQDVPDRTRLFRDVELYVAQTNNQGVEYDVCNPDGLRLTDSNSIEVYADMLL